MQGIALGNQVRRDQVSRQRKSKRSGGVMMRLRRDVAGNAGALMAVMLVPLMLFVGSAVDVSRVYTVKARLQQACDAGVLAGRRSMTDTSANATLDTTATTQANAFFKNNFHLGWMQTTDTSGAMTGTVFTPAKTTESQVSGTASVKVPMAIMRMFGFQPITLNVTCEARYDIADADIMFVLDQTGSMACLTSDSVSNCNSYVANNSNQTTDANGNVSVNEKTNSRISGVRAAVANFFDTVTLNADTSTNFRFGFVPYNATANVGKLLQPLGYVKNSVAYESRYVIADYINSTTYNQNYNNATTQKDCPESTSVRTPVYSTPLTYKPDQTATQRQVYWGKPNTTYAGKCVEQIDNLLPLWKYQQVTYDTSKYITGATVINPAEVDGSTSVWPGCVEERLDPNSNGKTSFSMTSPYLDMDPDAAPATASDGWAPWWYDVTFWRKSDGELSSDTVRNVYSRPYGSGYVDYAKLYNQIACPLAAKRLTSTTLPSGSSSSAKATVKASIVDYLSAAKGFKPYGTTYHDVGMMWGLRLLSPTGMFASDTAAWSGHNPPNRFIIFLTDGDMETDPASDGLVYSQFGLEKYDKRVGNGATGDNLDNYHNARFLAICQMAKNRNIKIFVIGYAQALTTQLTTCASPGQAYYASDTAGLNTAFSSIAKQVAMLRVSK